MATIITIAKRLNSRKKKDETSALIVLLENAASRTIEDLSGYICTEIQSLKDKKYFKMQVTIEDSDTILINNESGYGSVIINIEPNRSTTSITNEFIDQNGISRHDLYIDSSTIANIDITSIVDKILNQLGYGFDETKDQLLARIFGSNEDD